MVSLLLFPMHGLGETQHVVDQAGLLSSEEIQSLEEMIQQNIKDIGMDIVIVTTKETEGKTAEAFADDFYDYGGYGLNDTKDGMLFLIDMENRNFHLSTTGEMISILNNRRIEKLIDEVQPYLEDEEYYEGLSDLINSVTSYSLKGPDKGYVYDKETGKSVRKKYLSPTKWVVACLLGLISTISLYVLIANRYRLKKSAYAYPYYAMSDVTITQSEKHKTSDFVTSRHIPKSPPPGSGGSSTHTGSSGTSHGGGGGSF